MSDLVHIRRRAKELAADQGFKQILKLLKERSIYQWANTSSADHDRREELYRDIQAVGRLEHLIAEVISSENMDARKVERAAKPKPKP